MSVSFERAMMLSIWSLSLRYGGESKSEEMWSTSNAQHALHLLAIVSFFRVLCILSDCFGLRSDLTERSNMSPSFRNASFVYSDVFTSPVLNLLDARPGQKILDMGCGTGELTAKIETAVGHEGQSWGTDSSQDMVRPSVLTLLSLLRVRNDLTLGFDLGRSSSPKPAKPTPR